MDRRTRRHKLAKEQQEKDLSQEDGHSCGPVLKALKHSPTFFKEHSADPDDLDQEEQTQQHEPKLHADRMIPLKILPPLPYLTLTLTPQVILVQKLYVTSAMKDNHLHKDDQYQVGQRETG